ncbi:MAG TPA: NAD(P)-binding domain-containing protein [Candidatus Sulfotelmatobacter sp.]|nr:NAD(P)-binding domain-containing protein [Candidatus Sulfotelmatobacter sp.]
MNHKKVAVLGTGEVGITLAVGFEKHGYAVVMGTKTPGKKIEWSGTVVTYEEAAQNGEILVLAVKGTAAEGVVKAVAPHASGKTVIDVVNPISDAPPQKGVLNFFTTLDDSLMERLQRLAPQANFVKAFNSVGSDLMINPQLKGGPPSMFICGNSEPAKKEVTSILTAFGWETEDMGGVEAARAIEPLCILWCIPGFTRNEWTHAFKLIRP